MDNSRFLVVRGNPDVHDLQVFFDVTTGANNEGTIVIIYKVEHAEQFISQVDAYAILLIRDACRAGRHSRQYQ